MGGLYFILGQPQQIEEPFIRKRSKKISKNLPYLNQNIDVLTQFSEFQKEEVRRDLLYGYGALILKLGLLVVFSTSLVNLGLASHQRVNRNIELSFLLDKETKKFHKLRRRFDEMFVNDGEQSFLKEQDHWITPNSVRVIWR